MNQEAKQLKFFCEKTLSWLLGLFGCAGLFYFMTIAGANEYNLIVIASFFGSVYFLFKISAHAKSCLLEQYPSLKRSPRNPEVRINESKIFGPLLFTILFGPVGAWLILVVADPSSDAGKVLAMISGLALVFAGSFLLLNKST